MADEAFFKVSRATFKNLDHSQRSLYVCILSRINDHSPNYFKYGVQVPPGACIATSTELAQELKMDRQKVAYGLKKLGDIFKIESVQCSTPGRKAMMIYAINSTAKGLGANELQGKFNSKVSSGPHSTANSTPKPLGDIVLGGNFNSQLNTPIKDIKKSLQKEEQKQKKKGPSGSGKKTRRKGTPDLVNPALMAYRQLAEKIFPMTSVLMPSKNAIQDMMGCIMDCEAMWSMDQMEILFPMACEHKPGISNPAGYFRYTGNPGTAPGHPLGEQMAILKGLPSAMADDAAIKASKAENDKISADILAAGFMTAMADGIAKPMTKPQKHPPRVDHKEALGVIKTRLGKQPRKPLKDLKPSDRPPTQAEIDKKAMLNSQAQGAQFQGAINNDDD